MITPRASGIIQPTPAAARPFSGQKKPPCRRYKEEYGESCFYRGQPEPPAGLNDKKDRHDNKRKRGKNAFFSPAAYPGIAEAAWCPHPDFTRKKTRPLSGLNNEACSHFTANAPDPAGETARSQHGKIRGVPQAGNAPNNKKKAPPGEEEPKYGTHQSCNVHGPQVRRTLIIGMSGPDMSASHAIFSVPACMLYLT